MKILVNIGLWIYFTGVWIASIVNPKARLMIQGQRGLLNRYSNIFPVNRRVIWFHVSSLGEFEQGRTVIELWREKRPDDFILLTFFSPSGYENKKNYSFADHIDYLPFDSSFKMAKIIKMINPAIFILVKYDFWPRLLHHLQKQDVPTYLISGSFRAKQFFFKWYGQYFRSLIQAMSRIFVQDLASLKLLTDRGISHVELAGDTRIDRVKKLAHEGVEIAGISDFVGNSKVIIGGSSWPTEERFLSQFLDDHPDIIRQEDYKIILAPHDVSDDRLLEVELQFKNKVLRYSDFIENPENYQGQKVLLIDKIGLLQRLYQYGHIAFIGGGFGRSIHNILEPAAFGLAIVIGPNFNKFTEAIDLIELGAVEPVKDYSEFKQILGELLINEMQLSVAGAASSAYIKNGAGATSLITSCLLENS